MKSLNKIIPLVLYPFDVMVSFGETDEQLKKALIKHLPSDIFKDEITVVKLFNLSRSQKGHTTMFSGGQTVLRLKKIPTSPEDYGVLSHEIFHVVQFIFDRINIPLLNGSDEAYAYCIQYLTKEILQSTWLRAK